MNTFIHADIFFFVTTIAVILISIGIIVALIYIIIIVKNVSVVSKKVKEEGIEIIDDVKALRGDIKKEGFRMSKVLKLFGSLFMKHRRASKKDK